ncbi:MAG: fructosamine kinase family protein [Anaerolineae bacterium]
MTSARRRGCAWRRGGRRWSNGKLALPPACSAQKTRPGTAAFCRGAARLATLLQAEASTECPAFIAWNGWKPAPKLYHRGDAGNRSAALHRVFGPSFGLEQDNFIGANPQSNLPNDNWLAFFREQRLAFQMELARRNGYLTPQRARWLEKLLARLGDWLPAQPPASLLHGDLWGGNWLTLASGEPALIDPAVYYGHREADLAFTELFGGFPATFYTAYQSAWPLEAGYEERKHLYNLYHLLNHLNLFGEGYGSSVDSILRRYGN